MESNSKEMMASFVRYLGDFISLIIKTGNILSALAPASSKTYLISPRDREYNKLLMDAILAELNGIFLNSDGLTHETYTIIPDSTLLKEFVKEFRGQLT